MPVEPGDTYGWITEPILVVEYDSCWVGRANALIERLTARLHPWITKKIEHIGSTAVPGLRAKPVVDLMAPVASLDTAPAIEEALAPDLWNWMAPAMDSRSAERRIFVQVVDGRRHAHLHLAISGDRYWHEILLFRDRLREDSELANEYAALKLQLAGEAANRDVYAAGKSAFIAGVLAR
ncbi:MAG TPA: GrpB family protein [Gaiellaceae bacterium]|nr:GrpB family protein [Gaiellaceae bacterium]